MQPTLLVAFAAALWLTVVLTGCSFMAMGIELRCRGVPVRWWSFSFRFRKRIETLRTVCDAYRAFKRQRGEAPIFLWTMILCVAGIVIVPAVALIVWIASA